MYYTIYRHCDTYACQGHTRYRHYEKHGWQENTIYNIFVTVDVKASSLLPQTLSEVGHDSMAQDDKSIGLPHLKYWMQDWRPHTPAHTHAHTHTHTYKQTVGRHIFIRHMLQSKNRMSIVTYAILPLNNTAWFHSNALPVYFWFQFSYITITRSSYFLLCCKHILYI